jgi:hypothetical protein
MYHFARIYFPANDFLVFNSFSPEKFNGFSPVLTMQPGLTTVWSLLTSHLAS